MQYIGKLMRDVDPEPIREYLKVLKASRPNTSPGSTCWNAGAKS
ncbi:Uncharacterised protein [Chromobacterium violaceum]|uniref:Uncharacterized protein n=1 Tax=Chromobacterium violaceum TaxID=536 RepID=A0A447TH17_CHRVL|nr:Uncharacterised protein [Chromobacterium violaceum]